MAYTFMGTNLSICKTSFLDVPWLWTWMNGTSHFLKTKRVLLNCDIISWDKTRKIRRKWPNGIKRECSWKVLKAPLYVTDGSDRTSTVPSTVLRLKVDKGQGLRSGLLVSLFTFIILYITVNWWVDVFILIKFVTSLLTSLAEGKMLTVLQNTFLEN